MSKLRASRHPNDGDLLRYADGEVSAREARNIQSHLAACWQCRTEFAELQRTISDCVRYRQSVLRSSLPDPPAPWFDIYRRFAELDESRERQPWLGRLGEVLQWAVVRPWRWSAAIALIVIVFLIVDQLRNAPSVRAAELLQKAAVAEESRPKTPRRIHIRTRTRSVTRVVGATARPALSQEDAQALAAIRPRFKAARYDWDDPLSAASFAAWRNTLAEKQDEVTTIYDWRDPEQKRYRIRTTTASSELVEATLKLTMDNLRPVEGTLRFRDREWVEIAEVGEAPVPPPMISAKGSGARPAPSRDVAEPEPLVTKPATPGEELRVLAALHRLGADLGEPVEVSRDGSQVLVTGVGVSPELREQIHEELTGMPHVSVRFSDPLPGPLPPARRTLRRFSLSPGITRLQAGMSEKLGGRAAFEQFTDQVLAISDELMSRVHALRRLSESFPPETVSQLASEERQLLSRLRREHAVAVAGLAVALEEQCRPAFLSLGVRALPSPPVILPAASWQAATEELFGEARHSESLLAAMLGGAATETPAEELPAKALSSMARLRALTANYVRNALE